MVLGGPTDHAGEPIIQVLPSSEGMKDFLLRVEELIGALSVLEGWPAVTVLTAILQAQTSSQPARLPGHDRARTPSAPR
jgi:hypothetical protein